MTELSFLIELLLNHDLKSETKKAVAARIKEVEATLTPRPMQVAQVPLPPALQKQPASTLALMAKHGDIPNIPPPVMPPVPVVEQIAQTPATAAAMNARNEAIQNAISGTVDKTKRSPRKW